MVFSSLLFLGIFLPSLLLIYSLIDRKYKNMVLLLASLFFYGWGEPRFVFVMILSVGINYLFALGIAASRGTRPALYHWLFVGTIVWNLALFAVFKYLGFFASNISQIFSIPIPIPAIRLPIGISFFTFQAMSYVFDVYYGYADVEKNPFNVLLYISLFPQLVAGPIVRYSDVNQQIHCRRQTFPGFAEGACRFTVGLAKKVLLANSLGVLADHAFSLPPSQLSVVGAWLGVFSYALQIYFDFSGYSDMAIGLGKMFGFTFEENFDYPYKAKSISEFWRRWHISLGTWFRDYVYIPLGGSRGSNAQILRNLFIVWAMTGLWHGASWNFVAWGLYFFVWIALERFVLKKLAAPPAAVAHGGTLLLVLLSWVLFRANGIAAAAMYYKAMIGLAGNAFAVLDDLFTLRNNAVVFLFAVLFSIPFMPWLESKTRLTRFLAPAVPVAKTLSYMLLLAACVITMAVGSYNPFIYFNF